MNACIDCLPCLGRNAVDFAQRSTQDPELRKKIVSESFHFLSSSDLTMSPPATIGEIVKIAQKYTGEQDLYRAEKEKSNRLAELLLKDAVNIPEYDPESFESRLRMAVAGNILDFGIYYDLNIENALNMVRDSFRMPLDLDAVKRIHDRMESAKNILYLLDNCGEAVFDRVFMEPYREKITIGVRGSYILNDVTEADLPECGLANFAKAVINNGAKYIPGTDLTAVSKEFLDVFQSADLVIAKGQGNFETLNDCNAPAAFLFLPKCPTVAALAGGELRSIQVKTINF